MQWADENNYEVESMTPTRPCCANCTTAVQQRDPNLDTVEPMEGRPRSRVVHEDERPVEQNRFLWDREARDGEGEYVTVPGRTRADRTRLLSYPENQ